MTSAAVRSRGRLICIEGIDGTGKTSVARRLAREISATYYSTPPEPFRRIRKRVDRTADPATRFFFYMSSVQRASGEINTLLHSGDVVCDRYIEFYIRAS